MKTVQEYLRELDNKKIIETYLRYYMALGIDYSSEKEGHCAESRLNALISRLRGIRTDSLTDRKYVYVAHKAYKSSYRGVDYSIVCLHEVMQRKNKIETYNYYFTTQEELMGVLVSDTELTQENIYGLLAEVLFLISIDDNRMHSEEKMQQLAEMENKVEIESIDIAEVLLRKRSIIKRDRVEMKLRMNILESVYKYNQYCLEQEVKKLRNLEKCRK